MSEIKVQNEIAGIWPYLKVLGEQKAFIIVFCLSAIITSVELTYFFSEKYQSVATIVYQPQEVVNLKDNSVRAFGAPLPVPPFRLINENIKELMLSEATLGPVVEELGLDIEEPKTYQGPWYDRFYHYTKDLVIEYATDLWTLLKHGRLISEDATISAIKELRKNVKLANKNSYVFNIIVRNKKPERAARIADAIAERLTILLRDQQRAAGKTKLKQLRKLLDAKFAEIDEYQSSIKAILVANNIASVSIETERSMERLSNLELDKDILKSELEKTKAKLSTVTEYRAEKNRIIQGNTQRTYPNLLIQPEDFKRLSSEQLLTEIELKSNEPKYSSLLSSITMLKARLQGLPEIQHQLDNLSTQLQAAKRDFVQLGDAYQEAVIVATGQLSEAKILSKAHVPSIPTSPIIIYHVGLTAILALVISIGLVYILSYANIQFLFVTSEKEIPDNEAQQNQEYYYSESEKRYLRDRRKKIVSFSGQDRRKSSSSTYKDDKHA